MKKFIYISGVLLLNIFAFGSIFKITHWPGANIIFVIGIGLFAVMFLPLAVLKSYNDNGKKNASLYFAGFFCAFFCIISSLFKVLHLPGASVMLAISIPLPFIYFLPVYIYFHYKSGEKSYMNFIGIMLMMVFIAVFNTMLSLDISKEVYNSMNVASNSLSETTAVLKAKNDNSYELAKKCSDAQSEAKIMLLKKRTEGISGYIEQLKKELTNEVMGQGWESAKIGGIKNFPQKKSVDAGNTSLFMRGQDETGGKADELKKQLISYNDFVNELIAGDSATLANVNSLIGISDTRLMNEGNFSVAGWEDSYFRSGTYFIVVLGNLECIESNVKIAEAEVLNSIIN